MLAGLSPRRIFDRNQEESTPAAPQTVVNGRVAMVGSVITSYSIHYTKLYDVNWGNVWLSLLVLAWFSLVA